jgi:hypothetical protein
MGFSKPEECSQTLRVIVDCAPAPSATVVLRSDHIVDVGHPDGAQGNTLSSQPEDEAVGGVAVVSDGRPGKAALLAQPALEDHDLGLVRMGFMFRLVEPSQEAQPFNSATDEARSRLG